MVTLRLSASVSQLLLLSTDSNPDQLASVVVVNWDRSNSS